MAEQDTHPNSRKVLVGPHKVPMREISLSGGELPLQIYDTSGPQGHDVRTGLPALRQDWIAGRGDVQSVPRTYIPDSRRRAELPKSLFRAVLRGKDNVTQLHYARKGVVTPEMEFIATREGFDSTWSVMASRLMHPTLDSAQVALVREQLLAAVRQRGDNPDALASFVADTFAFSGHPYARSPLGTERSLARLNVAALKRYHDEQIVKSRMMVVIVGNVARAQVEKLVTRTLAKLPAGTYRWTLPDSVPPRATGFAIEPRSLPTNYILGYYLGPPAGSKDYQALRVAAAVLSGQLFAEIRSRRNLTYAVDAPFVDRAIASGGLYVTTVSPDTTLALMQQQITALRQGTIDREALERLVQQFITEYFLNNETNGEQANFLARAQLYRGDFRVADLFVDELRDVSPEDVQRVARQYMRDIRFAYVGDSTRLSARALRGF